MSTSCPLLPKVVLIYLQKDEFSKESSLNKKSNFKSMENWPFCMYTTTSLVKDIKYKAIFRGGFRGFMYHINFPKFPFRLFSQQVAKSLFLIKIIFLPFLTATRNANCLLFVFLILILFPKEMFAIILCTLVEAHTKNINIKLFSFFCKKNNTY